MIYMFYPVYLFVYPDKNIRQFKILIPREVWEKYRSISDDDAAKKFLKQHTNGMEWFIPGSPYYEAIETGVLNCNGRYPVVVTKCPAFWEKVK